MKWIIGISAVLPVIMVGCSDHPSKIGAQKEQALAVAQVAAPQADRSGKEAYEAVCKRCHGETGQGQVGLYPPLAGSRWVTGNPEVPIRIVTNGLEGPIEVDGKTYNSAMIAQRALFNSDAEFAAALTYVRTSWGNEGSRIDAADVAAISATGSKESAAVLEPLLAESGGSDAGGGSEEGGSEEGGSDEGGSDEGGADEGGADEGGSDEGGSEEGG
jgi:mono/diheme cytochrome c family protein